MDRSRLTVAGTPALSCYTIQSTALPSPLLDALSLALLGTAVASGGYWTWAGVAMGAIWGRAKTSVVLEESLLAIRGLGLQLTTTRGLLLPLLPPLRLSSSRLFLPISSLSNIVIQEGISGWEILYYLVVIQDEEEGVRLRVGFPETMPRLKELRTVWQGVRSTMFDELGDDEAEGELVC